MGLVRGLMTQHVMEAVSREMFGGGSGRKLAEQALLNLDKSGMADSQRALLRELLTSVQRFYTQSPDADASASARPGGITLPYSVKEEAVTGRDDVPYNGYAHSFAGMGIQFLLFRDDRYGRRHSARTSTRIVEAAAKRADLPDGRCSSERR